MRSSARRLTAALACTLALAACGSRSSGDVSSGDDPVAAERTSSGSTAPGPATAIADDFPLSAGMGGPQDTIPTSRTGTGLRDLELCGTSPLRGLGTRDRMVADNSGGEATNTRELVVLGTTDEAADLARSLSRLPAQCGSTPLVDGWALTTEAGPSSFGDSPDAVLVQRYLLDGKPTPGIRVVHVVQVGAALLVTWTYGEPADAADLVARTAAPLAEVVTAMGVYAEDAEPPGSGLASSSGSASPASAAIPDDFPLLAGWPESSTAEGDGGRTGPTRDGEALEFTACGETWREPIHLDRLRSDWVDAEDYRSRQLTTYEDDAAAADAVEALVSQQRSCPTEETDEEGFGTTREVRPVALGDEAWAILERDTFHGSPSIFGGSALVVRVGRAVLVVRHGGHAGFPSGDGRDQVEAMGSQAARSVEQMCQFTRTGC